MFSKLAKDKKNLITFFLLELIVALGGILTIVGFSIFNPESELIETITVIVTAYLLITITMDFFLIINYLSKIEKYLDRTDIQIATIFGNDVSPVFEFGNIAILVYNEEYEVVWMSQTTLLNKEKVIGTKVFELISNFDDLTQVDNSTEIYTKIDNKTFQIEINIGLKVVYLKDVSIQSFKNTQVEQERPFFGNIVIDNYQDVIVSLNEADFSKYVTEVKENIIDWAKENDLFIRNYGNDSFLIVGEEEKYQKIKKEGFSILDNVRKTTSASDNPLTISIGVGKGNTTNLVRTSELSYMALNMALSRGGDQIVVNDFGKPLEYYGAKNEVKQTRSHVRGRVLATSLANLIKTHNDVIIMGHTNLDFDALGACLGIYAIANSLTGRAHIVYDDDLVDYQAKRAFQQVFSANEINEMTISPSKVLTIVDDQSLVIVVDTHRPNSVMQPKLLDKCKEICVVDHHRKGDQFIEDPTFQYHEPSSSSASELVTELIYYQPSKISVSEEIANFLLAGICLDTKFFKSGTSSKTFEMSMVLKSYQASVEEVSEFFKEEYEEKKLISGIVNTSRALVTGVYVASSDEDDIVTKTALSKAAEEIMATKGVQAIFVVGRTRNNEVSISARSTSDFNVQIIMEQMGGGGHFSKAATQLTNKNIKETISELEEKVEVFVRDHAK